MAIASRLAPQAFYFGWMEHYARFLIYLTLLALVAVIGGGSEVKSSEMDSAAAAREV